MRAATATAIAIETGVDWSQDRGTGLRRWVFPAPAPRSRVKTMRGDAAELHG